MTRVTSERALWLSRHVLPHEPALRAWLSPARRAGLEIDDIVQETYARLVAMDTVGHVRNGKTYMFQVAHSILLTHVRRAKVVGIQTFADMDELGAAADEASPEQQVVARDELGRLASAIASLPPKAGEVFKLRRVSGFSQQEVAARLGISESTVEKHMSRAYHRLMDLFGYGGKPEAGASKGSAGELRRRHVEGDRSRN